MNKTIQKQIGDNAEDQACQFLKKHGLKLLTRNYHCVCGEIDLIMQDKEDIVFVEVRYRTQSNYASASETITSSKRKKLIRTATIFLQNKGWLHKKYSRFDVIAIDRNSNELRVNWIKDAFQA